MGQLTGNHTREASGKKTRRFYRWVTHLMLLLECICIGTHMEVRQNDASTCIWCIWEKNLQIHLGFKNMPCTTFTKRDKRIKKQRNDAPQFLLLLVAWRAGNKKKYHVTWLFCAVALDGLFSGGQDKKVTLVNPS